VAAIVPAGRRAGADLDRLGSPHRLTRPVRRSRLIECLDAMTAGRPHAPASVPAPTAVDAPPIADGPRRVLVADDYFANQRLVTRLLEKRGYLVDVVADGQAAVDAALGQAFDLVLMDCHMPVLDGYQATAQIRAGEHGRRTPILAMTANDSPEDRDVCLRAGMDDYLVKPIQAVVVLAAIERWSAIGRQQAGAAAPAGTPGGLR
jgi:CheY-like chemotaxis protein